VNISTVPDDHAWKQAYTVATNTKDDRHFYENMGHAMETIGAREQQLLQQLADTSVTTPEFYSAIEELEAINDALYLLNAYYDATRTWAAALKSSSTDLWREAS
jgi:hypothetical protein